MQKIVLTLAGLLLGIVAGAAGFFFLYYQPQKAGFKEKITELFLKADSLEKEAADKNMLKKELAKAQEQLELLRFKPSVSLKGDRRSLDYQNYIADKEGLKRAESRTDLDEMKKDGTLVKLDAGDYVDFDWKQLKGENRYCLPRVNQFLKDLSREFVDRFDESIIITSLIRTRYFQKKLHKRNTNATEDSSPHFTGATVDIKKRGLKQRQLEWLRNRLLEYEEAGLIEATEEFIQPNFHIFVTSQYKKLP